MEGEEEEENEEEQPPGLAKRLMAQHSQKENAANAGNSSKPVGGAGGKSKPPVADVPSAIQPATRSSKPAALVPEQQQGKSLGKRGNGRGKSAPLPANDEQLASGDAHHARPGAKRKSGGDAALDAVPLALSKKNKRSSSPEEHQEEVPGGGGGGEGHKQRQKKAGKVPASATVAEVTTAEGPRKKPQNGTGEHTTISSLGGQWHDQTGPDMSCALLMTI